MSELIGGRNRVRMGHTAFASMSLIEILPRLVAFESHCCWMVCLWEILILTAVIYFPVSCLPPAPCIWPPCLASQLSRWQVQLYLSTLKQPERAKFIDICLMVAPSNPFQYETWGMGVQWHDLLQSSGRADVPLLSGYGGPLNKLTSWTQFVLFKPLLQK